MITPGFLSLICRKCVHGDAAREVGRIAPMLRTNTRRRTSREQRALASNMLVVNPFYALKTLPRARRRQSAESRHGLLGRTPLALPGS